MSPTVRGRGLKRLRQVWEVRSGVVAHRAWAWVETTEKCCSKTAFEWSPTVRGRGLKHAIHAPPPPESAVAHRAWAWVETLPIKFLC